MVNWILGNTTRFKALVLHAGVYDLRACSVKPKSSGSPCGSSAARHRQTPDIYRQWSPSKRVEFFSTPTLVIHGERDYRVPIGQGLQLFTALQFRKVPSKLILFPDEGHWILKPRNSEFWYKNVIGWMDEWVKTGKQPGEIQVEGSSPFITRPSGRP